MTLSAKTRHAWMPIAAALLAALVFLNSLDNEFVWDDNELIVHNASVHNFSELARFFSGHFWSQSAQPSAQGYYRPLILLSYAVDYSLWAADPFGFHLTNMFWHALATALVCLVTARLTSSPPASFLAAALFAVHPVHVESVAFISGRTDVIATACALASFLLFLRERERKSPSVRLPLAILFFALALLAKEAVAVLPLLLLITETVGSPQRTGRSKVSLHAGYWLVLGFYLLVRFGILGIAPELTDTLSLREILLTMPIVAVDYLRLLLAPIGLCADYVVKPRSEVGASSIASITVIVVMCGIAAMLMARKRLSGFFLAWLLISLIPVMQLIPISVLKAERFLYLPSVGFCGLAGLAGGSLLVTIERRSARMAFGVASVTALFVFSILTVNRNTVWRDQLTLYRVTASCAPDNFRVQYNLGNAYFRAGELNDALRHTETAFRLRPDFPQVSYNLGVIYSAMGRDEEAERMYRTALKLAPDYAAAHNNLAAILYSRGRAAEAREEWKRALELDPDLEQAQDGLHLLESDGAIK
ncbi:MAG: tetratricopeptide repeat protein [Candidatus Abyssubacteria bacterium]